MDLELKDKSVFVAGSTKGIGLAIARAFLREGARVAITGRDAMTLNEAYSSLVEEASEAHLFPVQGDMTVAEDIHRGVEDTVAKFGGLDAVVAAIGHGFVRHGWRLSAEDWQQSLNANLVGSMLLATEALPHLLERGSGSFTFIASITGVEAVDSPMSYGVAKAGIISATNQLGRHFAARGVRVNAVAPGNIFLSGEWQNIQKDHPEAIDKIVKEDMPMHRFGRPEEIADVVVFLASARASFITGACIVADGGQTRSI